MTAKSIMENVLRDPTDFGDGDYPTALVNVTNVCNLQCSHCFVFRSDNPNDAHDKMNDETMLRHLEALRDKHNIKSMLFMGGEPMIRKDLVMEATKLFEMPAIVTNATYGIPVLPGGLVTVSLDGPEDLNDPIRGKGVFKKVKAAVQARDRTDGTTVMLQMVLTAQNDQGLEDFVEEVKDWPIDGIAFTFYVPCTNDDTGLAWDDLKDRDPVIKRGIALKERHPTLIKANVGALELMYSDRCLDYTGEKGEHCLMLATLPLYMGDGGNFERTFCCYGNDVDCSRCGAYSVFNTSYHRLVQGEDDYHHRTRHIPDYDKDSGHTTG